MTVISKFLICPCGQISLKQIYQELMSLKDRLVEKLKTLNCPKAAQSLFESKSSEAELMHVSADEWKDLMDTHNTFDAMAVMREVKAKPTEQKAIPAVLPKVININARQVDMFAKILTDCLEEFMKPNAVKPEEGKRC
jgi:hypothetical protein